MTDASENSKATGVEVHVVYKPLALGGTHTQGLKKSESSHYKQIAAKDLVLASGTTNREHGVFFRLRPSRAASLEGGKEFTFLATVPRTLARRSVHDFLPARAKKTSVFSTSVVPAGADQTLVGMYLAGDLQAAALAEELRECWKWRHAPAAPARQRIALDTFSTQAAGFFTGKKPTPPVDKIGKTPSARSRKCKTASGNWRVSAVRDEGFSSAGYGLLVGRQYESVNSA